MAQDPAQKNYEDLTSPRLKSNKVGLGTLHKDLQDIRQELQGNDSLNTGPVNPLLNLVPANQELPRDAEKPGILEQLKASAIMGIKEALGVDTTEDDDSKQKSAQVENQQIFDEFSKLVLQQQNLLLDATKEQTDIFKKLSDTIAQLKTTNKEDSAKLRKSIDGLAKKLKDTPDTAARRGMERAVTPKPSAPAKNAPTSKTTPFKSEVKAKTSAVPAAAFAFTVPVAANAPLYEDAGLIGSESEGDRVQSGEREMDMATILGFLGSMFGGGDSSGPMIPFMPRGGPNGKPGKPGTPLSKPGAPTQDKSGRWRDAKGRYTKAPQPKAGGNWWEKLKSAGSKAKPAVGGALEAASMAKWLGLSALFMPSELGNGELSPEDRAAMFANAQTPNSSLVDLETRHQQIQAEMYELIKQPNDPEVNAKIDALNKEAAENIRRQNSLRNNVDPAPATKPNTSVIDQSLQNKDLMATASQPAAPVIINNQQTVGNNTPPAYIAPSLEVRPKESALDRYINRQTVY